MMLPFAKLVTMLTLFLCSLGGVVNAGVVQDLCELPLSLWGKACSFSIEIPDPTTIEVGYFESCTHNWCTWDCGQCTNNCCTWDCGQAFGIPCSGCSKSKCGETCLSCSGFSEMQCGQTCIDLPDSISIEMMDVSLCDIVPPVIENALEMVESWCPCLEDATDYIANMAGDAEADGYTEAKAEALVAAGNLVDCMATSLPNYESNKVSVLASTEADGGGEVLWGEEIGLSEYAQIVAAGAICVNTGDCEILVDVLLNVLLGGMISMATELKMHVSDHYVKDFVAEVVTSPIYEVMDAVFSTDGLTPFEQLVQEVTVCADQLTAELKTDFLDLQYAYDDALFQLRFTFDQVISAHNSVISLVDNIDAALDFIIDTVTALDGSLHDHLQDILNEGKGAEIFSVIEFIIDNDDIRLVKDDIVKVSGFLRSLEDLFGRLEAQITNVKDSALLLFHFQSPCSDQITYFEGFLEETSVTIHNVHAQLVESLGEFATFGIQTGVATYQHSLKVRVDNLPCSRLSTQSFSSPLCPFCDDIVLDVPEFYLCTYEENIPLPNAHLPFLRVLKEEMQVVQAIPFPAAPPLPAPVALAPSPGPSPHIEGWDGMDTPSQDKLVPADGRGPASPDASPDVQSEATSKSSNSAFIYGAMLSLVGMMLVDTMI